MALKLKVANIICDGCAEKITESTHIMEPDAQVNVNVQDKTVPVESTASEESMKQTIVVSVYHIAGY